MDGDEYALTEAEVLDTLQLIVAAETLSETLDETLSETLDAPAVKSYQNRQKQELDYLKAKVRELERELLTLEQANDDKLARVGDAATWQRVAKQQLLEKQKSLSENARLRGELESQLKFAKSLERVIRKRPNLTAFGAAHETGDTVHRRRKKRRGAGALFHELSETCEREFQRTNEALAASGLTGVLRDQRSIDVKVIDDDDVASVSSSTSSSRDTIVGVGDLRVDWTIVRRYPFPFQAVARELWKLLAFNRVATHVKGIQRTVEHTDDSLFATTTLSLPLGRRVCTLSASAIIRQYVESDSVTVVWVSDGECETSKSTKDTFKLFEVGWIRLQAVPDDPSSCISHTLGYYFPTFSARSSSPSDSDTVGSPVEPSSTPQDAEDVGILTELLTTVYDKSASQMHIAIENALMAEAVGQSPVVL